MIAVVANTNSKVELHQIELKTKSQEIDLLEQKLQENEKTNKSLKEKTEENKKLQQEIERLQAIKAEKARIAQEQAQNPVQASSVAPVSGDCATWMDQAGITHARARELIQRESGCNPRALNPSSGACGISQALPCSKMGAVNPDGTSAVSPVNQLVWMNNYILQRYGSWDKALEWHDQYNWY